MHERIDICSEKYIGLSLAIIKKHEERERDGEKACVIKTTDVFRRSARPATLFDSQTVNKASRISKFGISSRASRLIVAYN